MLQYENLAPNKNMLASEVLQRKNQINKVLLRCFDELGRKVSAQEAFEWEKENE